MSYQVLATKWRPKVFSDVIGQDHILPSIIRSLSNNRVYPSWLFVGTRGIGKTTIARLVAKSLSCKNGITPNPCRQCSNCKEIEKGEFIDLLEIDAASKTKVDDIRDLLDNSQYLPVTSRFKIYLIDEVHMLSRYSFSALLKILEEPPEHVKFLLATTELQKIPINIISRCFKFYLRSISTELIYNRLIYIMKQEDIIYSPEAIQTIAESANGSMRDGLNLTDQVISMSHGSISIKDVNEILGLSYSKQSFFLVKYLIEKNARSLVLHLSKIENYNWSWDVLLTEILILLYRIIILQILPEHKNKFQNKIDNQEYLFTLIGKATLRELHFYYKILITGRKELIYAPNDRIGIEVVLLRALFTGIDEIEKKDDKYMSKKTSSDYYCTNNNKLNKKTINHQLTNNDQLLKEHDNLLKKIDNQLIINNPIQKSEFERNVVQNTEVNNFSTLCETNLILESQKENNWVLQISRLNMSKNAKRLAVNTWKEEKDNNVIHLHIRNNKQHLVTSDIKKEIENAISEDIGHNIMLDIVEDNDMAIMTPLEIYEKQITEAHHTISLDNKISMICDLFNVEIENKNIFLK